jgi:hypothetical protein
MCCRDLTFKKYQARLKINVKANIIESWASRVSHFVCSSLKIVSALPAVPVMEPLVRCSVSICPSYTR